MSLDTPTGDLAEWLRDARLTQCDHSTAMWSDCCVTCLRDRLLASDWLKAHDEDVARKAWADGYNARVVERLGDDGPPQIATA